MVFELTVAEQACRCQSGHSIVTLIVAALVAAAATLIAVDWSEYAWAFRWTRAWSLVFYGIYVLAGAGAGALFVVVFEYLFGGEPEAGIASWLAGVSFGLAGAAAIRADLSRVPEVGDALSAIKKLGSWVRGGLNSQIEAVAPARLSKVPPGPLGDWVRRALENHYQSDQKIKAPKRKATIARVNRHLDTLADSSASKEEIDRALDGVFDEVCEWIPVYRLKRPLTRPRTP